MSSNTNNKDKKNKPLSASSLCKTASKYTTRSQTAEKASSSKLNRNTDLTTLSDQNLLNQINSVLSEGYNGDLQSSIPPIFEDRTEYTSKKQTEHERQTREENLTQINNMPQLPVESDIRGILSGSLYPATGHNQSNQQIASQIVYDVTK